jgi:hypothetical protein
MHGGAAPSLLAVDPSAESCVGFTCIPAGAADGAGSTNATRSAATRSSTLRHARPSGSSPTFARSASLTDGRAPAFTGVAGVRKATVPEAVVRRRIIVAASRDGLAGARVDERPGQDDLHRLPYPRSHTPTI